MKLKKLLSAALTVAMVGTAFSATALAAPKEYANGKYTATVHFLHETKDQLSMCDPLFVHTADLTFTDDTLSLEMYVANPVPAFPEQGADGTVKNVKITIPDSAYGPQEYEVKSDMETKAVKEFDTSNSLFGIEAGSKLTTQKLSVDLPRKAISELEKGAKTVAYVNVVMNNESTLRTQLSDIKAVEESKPDAGTPEVPTVTETKSSQITADVKEVISKPEYNVTVPQSIALGTLSSEKDNELSYKVNVKASNLNGATVTVTAPESGKLLSGKNEIAFANSFGTKSVSKDTAEAGQDLTGSVKVTKETVKAAKAGNYAGTTTFAINFAPAK